MTPQLLRMLHARYPDIVRETMRRNAIPCEVTADPRYGVRFPRSLERPWQLGNQHVESKKKAVSWRSTYSWRMMTAGQRRLRLMILSGATGMAVYGWLRAKAKRVNA